VTPRFILIDPTLGSGKLYSDGYARTILAAVRARGWRIVVAGSATTRPSPAPPLNWRWIGAFRYPILWPPRREWRALGKQGLARRVESFEAGCRAVFDRIGRRPDDRIFVPMVSELDVLGLGRFLRREPPKETGGWHLQLHFPVGPGRPVALLAEARAMLAGHRVSFYATNDNLTHQLNALGIARFETLPHPSSPRLMPSETAVPRRPLRLTLAGIPEARKRYGVSEAIEAARELLVTGQAQIVVQTMDPKPPPPERRKWRSSREPVVDVPGPLSPEEYVTLIRHSDVGLLLYQPLMHYARCSGVLHEMLSAGVPVLVPAGCALADTIQGAIYAYRRRRLRSARHCGRRVTAIGRRLQSAVPPAARDVAVELEWRSPVPSYVRVSAEFVDRAGRTLATADEVVGAADGLTPSVLFPVPAPAARVRIHAIATRGRATNMRLAATFLTQSDARPRPRAAVGRTFSGPGDIRDALQEVVAHWCHYRRTALAFSRSWRRRQSADRLLAILEMAGRARPLL
jgi:hypothetical protein